MSVEKNISTFSGNIWIFIILKNNIKHMCEVGIFNILYSYHKYAI